MFSTKPLFNTNTESQNIKENQRKLIIVRQSASMNRCEKLKTQNVCLLFARGTQRYMFSTPTEENFNIKIVIYITQGCN